MDSFTPQSLKYVLVYVGRTRTFYLVKVSSNSHLHFTDHNLNVAKQWSDGVYLGQLNLVEAHKMWNTSKMQHDSLKLCLRETPKQRCCRFNMTRLFLYAASIIRGLKSITNAVISSVCLLRCCFSFPTLWTNHVHPTSVKRNSLLWMRTMKTTEIKSMWLIQSKCFIAVVMASKHITQSGSNDMN